jgi:transcriptional regulator with XRE-family HTH domain
MMGMSQEKLAESLGLTFQQVQKYEKGTNRVGSGRLHDISRILEVSLSYFFDGLDDGATYTAKQDAKGDLLRSKDSLQLLQAFDSIQSASVRRALLNLTRELAGQPSRE